MWMPPDPGKQFSRELERKQMEEAYLREGRTGRPSHLLNTYRLGFGRKLLMMGVALIALVILMVIASFLTSPSAG